MSLDTHQPGDGVSIRQLRLLVRLSETGNLRTAAKACSVSQPAATQALAILESMVGCKLVERSSRGSVVNAHGTVLVVRARRFLDRIERALIDVRAAGDPVEAATIVNRLTRSHCRALVGIVPHSSFERASRTLGTSVPSLKRAVRSLEASLGMPLLQHVAARTLVGPAGLLLGRQIRLAMQEIEDGIEEIAVLRGKGARRLRIGAMPFGGGMLLASASDDFLADHPLTTLDIVNGGAADLQRRLRDGDVDLVVGLLPVRLDPELVGLPLAVTPYYVVVDRRHPLACRSRVTLAQLADQDWVVGEPGSSRRACFDWMFAGRAMPRAQISTCGTMLLQQLIDTTGRVALMTSYELETGPGGLRRLAVDPVLPNPSIGVMQRADWLPTRVHERFVAAVRRSAAAHDETGSGYARPFQAVA